MRFDFFRRTALTDATIVRETTAGPTGENAEGSTEDALYPPESNGYVSYALQLDAQMRVKGYRFGWRQAALVQDGPPATDTALTARPPRSTRCRPPRGSAGSYARTSRRGRRAA